MKDCELMDEEIQEPNKIISTKPEITIIKPLNCIEVKFILPPSKCEITLHQRFTKLLCRLHKRGEIDPGYEEYNIPNTMIGRLERLKMAARLAAAPYHTRANQPAIFAAMKARKSSPVDMFDELPPDPHPVVPGRPISIYAKFLAEKLKKSTYCTGPPKSKEELDDEINQYWVGRIKRTRQSLLNKDVEMAASGDNNVKQESDFSINDLNISNGQKTENKPTLFSKFWQVIKSRSAFAQEKASLDKDLDSYFHLDRKNLDDDLDDYRRQDPRLQDKSDAQSVATLGADRDEDFDEDFSDE